MGRGFQPLGGRGEFFLVVGGAFGIFVLASVWFGFGFAKWPGHSDRTLASTVVYELLIFAVLVFVLRRRGWSWNGLGFETHWSDALIGIGLAFAAYCFYAWGFWALAAIFPGLMSAAVKAHIINHGLSPWVVWPVVVVNPVYEELFVTAYVISALKDGESNHLAVNTSTAIRLSYHLYQGVIGVVAILPLGLMFAYWYARTRRIWPLIIAHAILDFLAFYPRIGG